MGNIMTLKEWVVYNNNIEYPLVNEGLWNSIKNLLTPANKFTAVSKVDNSLNLGEELTSRLKDLYIECPLGGHRDTRKALVTAVDKYMTDKADSFLNQFKDFDESDSAEKKYKKFYNSVADSSDSKEKAIDQSLAGILDSKIKDQVKADYESVLKIKDGLKSEDEKNMFGDYCQRVLDVADQVVNDLTLEKAQKMNDEWKSALADKNKKAAADLKKKEAELKAKRLQDARNEVQKMPDSKIDYDGMVGIKYDTKAYTQNNMKEVMDDKVLKKYNELFHNDSRAITTIIAINEYDKVINKAISSGNIVNGKKDEYFDMGKYVGRQIISSIINRNLDAKSSASLDDLFGPGSNVVKTVLKSGYSANSAAVAVSALQVMSNISETNGGAQQIKIYKDNNSPTLADVIDANVNIINKSCDLVSK